MTTFFFQIKRQQLAVIFTVLTIPVSSVFGQLATFKGQTLTGTLTQAGTVDMKGVANANASPATASTAVSPANDAEIHVRPVLRPPVQNSGPYFDVAPVTPRAETATIVAQPVFRGFNGLTHLDQRTARNGNQFSTEPPDQGLALGNGFVLEAVNSALNVYDVNGIQQLVHPVALSQFFNLPPESIARPARSVFSPGTPVRHSIPNRSAGS
jgi:hypothetical protein